MQAVKYKIQDTKYKILKTNWLVFCLVLVSCLLPLGAGAVSLYLEPPEGQYQPGDTFSVEIKVDTEGECINAVEASLSFSQILNAADFSRGKSIITLWIQPPKINQEKGEISFSGGIPGGYCGRVSGDPGASNLLGKIIFKIPGMIVRESEESFLEVKFLDTSQVLLNDGLGTVAGLTTQGAIFKIVPQRTEPLKKGWLEEIKQDVFSPEPFQIKIQQEPTAFEGKYFIIFVTTDKQTGLDHYEVKETRNRHETEHETTLNWKVAESPYLLKDQGLKSIIKVKAVDKAGNERTAEYIPEILKKPFPYWIILLILGGVGVVWRLIRKPRTSK